MKARKRKYLSGRKRRDIWEKFGKRCGRCGVKTVLFISQVGFCSDVRVCHVDHIIPFSRGGSCADDNFQLLCGHCNCSKGAKDDSGY